MMGNIYENSSTVLIWLGPNDLGQSLIVDIQLHVSDMEKHFTDLSQSLTIVRTGNSWWRRDWTLQEAVLGPSLTFCSGKERCSGGEFEEYLQCLHEHLLDQDACCKALLEDRGAYESFVDNVSQFRQIFRSRRIYQNKATHLLRLALDHQDRESIDPRDKVFAFTGIATTNSVPPNLVQYGRPVLETMINIATKLIQKTNTLEVIRHAAGTLLNEEDFPDRYREIQRAGGIRSQPRLQDLPSWCPDWTQDIPIRVLKTMQGRFGAGTAYQPNVEFHSDRRLGVTRIKCDRILHVGEWAQWSLNPDQVHQTLRQWCYMLGNSLAHHASRCDGCERKIYGVQFRSQVCKDFNFCSHCMQKPPVSHLAEHKFSLGYFVVTDRSGLTEEVKLRNRELRSVPNVKLDWSDDGSALFSGSGWEQLPDVDYPFTDRDSLEDSFRRTLLGDHPTERMNGTGLDSKLSTLEERAAFTELWCTTVEPRLLAIMAATGMAATRAGRRGIRRTVDELMKRMRNMEVVPLFCRIREISD